MLDETPSDSHKDEEGDISVSLSTNTKNVEYRSRRNVFALLSASLIVNLAFGVIVPILPLYVEEITTDIIMGPWFIIQVGMQVGMLTSAFMISRTILAPIFGKLSDSEGRKPIILIGMSMYGFLCLGYGLANDVFTLFIVRFIQGVASAAVWPVAESLMADISHERDLGKNMGLFVFSFQLGFALGPFIGAGGTFLLGLLLGIAEMEAMKILFYAMAGLALISVPVLHLTVKDPLLEGRSTKASDTIKVMIKSIGTEFRSVLQQINHGISQRIRSQDEQKVTENLPSTSGSVKTRSRAMLALYGTSLVNGFGFSMIWPVMTLFYSFFYNLDVIQTGLLIGIVSSVGMLVNPLAGVLADKTSKKWLVVSSEVLSALFTMVLGIQAGLIILIAILLIRQTLYGVRMPSFRALQAEVVPKQVRGREFGRIQGFFNLGSIFGPIIGGLLFDMFLNVQFVIPLPSIEIILFGPTVMFVTTALLSITGASLIARWIPSRSNP